MVCFFRQHYLLTIISNYYLHILIPLKYAYVPKIAYFILKIVFNQQPNLKGVKYADIYICRYIDTHTYIHRYINTHSEMISIQFTLVMIFRLYDFGKQHAARSKGILPV